MSKAPAESEVAEVVSSAEAISLTNLSVKAGTQTLLSDVNVTFPAGEIALVVGPQWGWQIDFDADHRRADQ